MPNLGLIQEYIKICKNLMIKNVQNFLKEGKDLNCLFTSKRYKDGKWKERGSTSQIFKEM